MYTIFCNCDISKYYFSPKISKNCTHSFYIFFSPFKLAPQNTINTGTPRPARNPEIISVSSLGTNSIQNTQNTLNNAVSSSSGAQPPQQPSISNRFGDDDLVGSAAIPSIVVRCHILLIMVFVSLTAPTIILLI